MTDLISGHSEENKKVAPKTDLKQPFNFQPQFIQNTAEYQIAQFVSQMNNLLNIFKEDQTAEEKVADWSKIDNVQKQFTLDVFSWKKDEFNSEVFQKLLPSIKEGLKDNTLAAHVFFNSFEFHLYLKQNFTFYPFEQEENNYPEHDNYFVSKDFSFVFCYKPNERCIEEMEEILELILQSVGSEYFISKLEISRADSYTWLEEEAYGQRNSRLASAGYVSYEDSLEWQSTLPNSRGDSVKKIGNSATNEVTNQSSLQISEASISQSSMSLLKTLQAIFEFKKSNEVVDFSQGEKLLKETLDDVLFYTKMGKQLTNNSDFKLLYRTGKTFIKQFQRKVSDFRKFAITLETDWTWLGDLVTGCIDDADDILLSAPNILSPFNLRSYAGIEVFKSLLDFWQKNSSILVRYKKMLDEPAVAKKWSSSNYKISELNIEQMLITDFICFCSGKSLVEENTALGISWSDLEKFHDIWKKLAVSERSELIETFYKEKFQADAHSKVFSIYLELLLKEDILSLNISALSEQERKFIGSVILV